MSISRQEMTRKNMMPGMRPFPREKVKPIEDMNAEELRKLKQSNDMILCSMTAGTSTVLARLKANQAKIMKRLAELENMENLQHDMRHATIDERGGNIDDDAMAVDSDSAGRQPISATDERYVPRTVRVKQQAIAAWGQSSRMPNKHKTKLMSPEDAIALEEEKNRLERGRLERARARQERLTMPNRLNGTGQSMMSREEYEAKVWAFMTYKPTDLDLEAEEEEDESEDEDPASWFDDDQDDGIKGQNIVYPDSDDLASIIRVDYSKIIDCEPRDDGD